MKTLSLSLLCSLVVSVVAVPGHSATLAPTPSPAASPLPATEPEAAADGRCPVCKMDGAKSTTGGDGSADNKSADCCAMDKGEKDPAKAATDDKTQAAKRAQAEKEVLELELKWCEAEARHDVAFLEKVEADDFAFTDSNGKLTTKKDEIAEAKQGGDEIEFKLSDMKAHVYGDAAILTGLTTFNPDDTDSPANSYRWTDVFVRQANGEWQVVASQATTLAQEKTTGDEKDE